VWVSWKWDDKGKSDKTHKERYDVVFCRVTAVPQLEMEAGKT